MRLCGSVLCTGAKETNVKFLGAHSISAVEKLAIDVAGKASTEARATLLQ